MQTRQDNDVATPVPRICDYEGSDYRTRFWEDQGRDYEDKVERAVIRRILPSQGRRMLELGAGFGRLTDEYRGYEHVVLLDYSFSQLQFARERYGDVGFTYVAADAYRLPFKANVFDGATMIRVIHHFENVPAVLSQVTRVLADQALFILEYANKRNLKAMLRYRLGRQTWNPAEPDPVEFVELNFNFHPVYMARVLSEAGFHTHRRVPVSFLRLGALKRSVPAGILAGMDGILQKTGWLVSPSIFTANLLMDATSSRLVEEDDTAIFACPSTGGTLRREADRLVNDQGQAWPIRDGIYDFKTML